MVPLTAPISPPSSLELDSALSDGVVWLSINNPYSKTFRLKFQGTFTRSELRRQIEKATGIASSQQTLLCNQRYLNGEGDLHLGHEATIYIVPHPSARPVHVSPGGRPRQKRSAFDTISLACPKGDMNRLFRLEIFIPAGKTIRTFVAGTTTTAELAYRIEEQLGIPRRGLRLAHEGALVYSGQEAEDSEDYPAYALDEVGESREFDRRQC